MYKHKKASVTYAQFANYGMNYKGGFNNMNRQMNEFNSVINTISFTEEEFDQAKKDVINLFQLLEKNRISAFPLLDKNLISNDSYKIDKLSDILECIEIINSDYERIYLSHGNIDGSLGCITVLTPIKDSTIFYVYDGKNKIFFYFNSKKFFIFNVDDNLMLKKFEAYDSPERLLLLMKKEVQEWV